MTARGGKQQEVQVLGPRLCTGCGHYHGGRAYGLCLMHVDGVVCPCNIVQAYGAGAAPQAVPYDAPVLAVPEPRSGRAGRRPWFQWRWRWFRLESRTHHENRIRGMPTLRRRRA